MADYIVTSGELTTVANAIRAKNGTSSNLSWPDGFVSGISSGGGGSSDFSTAQVTVIKDTIHEFTLSIPNIINNTLYSIIASEDFESGDVLQVPLYKGSVNNIILDNDNHITGVGNVITGPEGYVIGITGDCTITI